MSFSWHEIHEDLTRTSTTLRFHQTFAALRCSEAALERFRDPAAVLNALHATSGDPDRKNLILGSLVQAAQVESPAADTALVLTLLALWPGLDAVLRRARARRLRDQGDLASEILARATEAIRCLDLQRVARIAATILMNIERDIGRVLRREDDRQKLFGTVDPDWIAAPPSWSEQVRLRSELAGDLPSLIGEDTCLVMGVTLDGYTQAEMAVMLDISEAAARKRYQRATARIRDTRQRVDRSGGW